MSLRNTSGIIGVDKETKDIVWKKQWPDVAQQHCPVVTNAGTLVAFCNGNIRPWCTSSRIVEFDLETKEMIWSYVDDMPQAFFSSYMGSVQRLWNGNTFICESAFGRLFEVTTKEKLFGNMLFRSLQNILVRSTSLLLEDKTRALKHTDIRNGNIDTRYRFK